MSALTALPRLPSPCGRLLLLPALLLAACSGGTPPVTTAPAAGAAPPPAAPDVSAATPPTAAIDQQPGFRGHRFGDSLAAFPGLRPAPYAVLTLPGVREYVLPAGREQLRVGQAPLRSITYAFYRGRFYQVSVVGAGVGCAALLAALTARYGPPAQPNPYRRTYWWRGQRATAQLTQVGMDAPRLWLFDNALLAQAEAAQQQAVRAQGQAGARDL